MRRAVVLVYGVVAYVAMLAAFAALAAFGGNFGVVRGIDQGPATTVATALAIDLALLAVFGVSHSVLARARAKRRLTAVIPEAAERSTYVLVASASLGLLMWQWRPLPQVVWHVSPLVLVVQGAGVLLSFASTFLTDHFDLFGLRQVWLHARGVPYTPVPFVERWIYTRVRHPMMLGFLVWLWATPVMTTGHLVFALGLSAYIAIGTAYEERDLARAHGAPYRAYRARVRAIVPLRKTTSGDSPDRRAP